MKDSGARGKPLEPQESVRQVFVLPPEECDLCTGTDGLELHSKCHPTAPLRARFDGDVLTLSCYVPDCNRHVVDFLVTRTAPTSTHAKNRTAQIDDRNPEVESRGN